MPWGGGHLCLMSRLDLRTVRCKPLAIWGAQGRTSPADCVTKRGPRKSSRGDEDLNLPPPLAVVSLTESVRGTGRFIKWNQRCTHSERSAGALG